MDSSKSKPIRQDEALYDMELVVSSGKRDIK